MFHEPKLPKYLSPAEYAALCAKVFGTKPKYGHLNDDDNACLRFSLLRLAMGQEPLPGFKRLAKFALGGLVRSFADLKARLAVGPVPRDYLPNRWEAPKVCIFLFSQKQHEVMTNQDHEGFPVTEHFGSRQGLRSVARMTSRASYRTLQLISRNGQHFTAQYIATKDAVKDDSGWDDSIVVDAYESQALD